MALSNRLEFSSMFGVAPLSIAYGLRTRFSGCKMRRSGFLIDSCGLKSLLSGSAMVYASLLIVRFLDLACRVYLPDFVC